MVVTRHLICLLHLLLLIAGTVTAAQAIQLDIQLESRSSELGKPLWGELIADDLQLPLDSIDLSEWYSNWHVEKADLNRPTANQQRLRLRLYPRQTGHLTLSPVYFAGLTTTPVSVHIKPAIDPKSGLPMQVEYQYRVENKRIKSPMMMLFSVTTESRSIVLDVLPTDLPGLMIERIPPEQQSVEHNGKQLTRHTSGWVVTALNPGTKTIRLPVIAYVHDGVTTHRFYPPPCQVEIAPLPVYLPPTMPIGQLQLEYQPLPSWLMRDRLMTLELRLHGQQIPAQWLPSLHKQFRSNSDIQFYPATVETVQTITSSGINSLAVYRIPFKTKAIGLAAMPTLNLQFFESEQGKLVSQSIVISRPPVFNWPILLLTGVIISLLSFVTGRYLLIRLHHKLFVIRHYREAYRLLGKANTLAEVRAALDAIAQAEHWPVNMTIGNWAKYWRQQYPKQDRILSACQQLEKQAYSRDRCKRETIQAIAQSLQGPLRSVKPIASVANH